MMPKCLKPRKSVTASDRRRRIAAPAAASVASQVSRCATSTASAGVLPLHPSRLEVARHVDDAEVDPVARDDADQEAGR